MLSLRVISHAAAETLVRTARRLCLTRRKSGILLSATGILGVASCRGADVTSVRGVSSARPQLEATRAAVARAVAAAGCSLGVSDGSVAARVRVFPRERLPFRLPSIEAAFATGARTVRMRVVRVAVPAPSPYRKTVLACVLPAAGDYATIAVAEARKVGDGGLLPTIRVLHAFEPDHGRPARLPRRSGAR